MLNHWVQKDGLLSEMSFDRTGERGETLKEIFDVLREDETITFVREKTSSGRKIVEFS